MIFRERMRPEAQQSAEWIERHFSKIHASLDAMNKSLGDNAHCMGINYSLADIAVGCALGYLDLRFASLDWRTGQPNLARLYEKLSQRQSFIDTIPKPA
jgi:glutathione S-transferase